ncbi:MAG: glycine cleavage system protein GcvH [Actinobacteria bacterium ATB1]|nr:glycine cleavage system protein GcvH [Actinobacteria bacterium ATB1]
MNIPEDLRYTKEHEWARLEGGQVRVGITDFAQNALGDVVFVQVPETGDLVTAGDVFGEVESTKSVSDLYAPLSGTVTAVNESLEDAPELVNSDPYGEGWLILVDPDDSAALDGLLDAAGYRGYLDESG